MNWNLRMICSFSQTTVFISISDFTGENNQVIVWFIQKPPSKHKSICTRHYAKCTAKCTFFLESCYPRICNFVLLCWNRGFLEVVMSLVHFSTCTDLLLTSNKVTWRVTASTSLEVDSLWTIRLDPLCGENQEPTDSMHFTSLYIKVQHLNTVKIIFNSIFVSGFCILTFICSDFAKFRVLEWPYCAWGISMFFS